MMLSKYGVARHVYVPVVKRAVVDYAVGADWTPAAGDVKISKDGGAAANVTNLPIAIAMGNTAIWDFSLTATEMQAALVVVTVADAATKAVEDQAIVIETYGNASAQHPFDLGTALASQTVGTASAVTAVSSGGITASSFAAGAVDASAIATDAIGSAEIASSAATEIADAVWNTLRSTHLTSGSFGELLQAARSGTAQAGAAGSVTLDASASSVTDFYVGEVVALVGGTGAGQARVVTAYDGTTKVATVARNWATNPDATSVFVLLTLSVPKVDASLQVTAASVQGNVTGSVGSVTGAVGSVTGNVGGNVTGSVGSVAAGGITAGSLATDTITAAKIAADAIGASELAADAVTEIQAGIATASALAAVQADTDDIQARLPATLVGGKMDSHVNDIATDALTSGALAASAVNEIADGVLDRAIAEPTGIFAWPGSLRTILGWLGVVNRNKKTQTATTTSYRNDADSATLATRTVSDDGTTFVASEAT